MRVLRAFDHYQPGDTMTPEDVAEQRQRGNIPDLLTNGFIERGEIAVVVDYNDMTVAELRTHAKAADVQGYYKMKRDELIGALDGIRNGG